MNYCAVAMGVIYYQYFLNQFLCSWLAMAVDITYIVECKRVGNALLLYCWVWQCIAIRTASPPMAEKLEEVKASWGRAAEGHNRQNLQKYCFINFVFKQQQKGPSQICLDVIGSGIFRGKNFTLVELEEIKWDKFQFPAPTMVGKEGLGLQKSFGQM